MACDSVLKWSFNLKLNAAKDDSRYLRCWTRVIWHLAHLTYSNTPPDGKDARQSRKSYCRSDERLFSNEVHAVTGGHRSGSLKRTVVTWDDSGELAEGAETKKRVQKQVECRNRKMLEVHSLSTIIATDGSPRVVQRHTNDPPGRLIWYVLQRNSSRCCSLTHGERSPCASIPYSSLNYKVRPHRKSAYIEPYPDIRNRSSDWFRITVNVSSPSRHPSQMMDQRVGHIQRLIGTVKAKCRHHGGRMEHVQVSGSRQMP